MPFKLNIFDGTLNASANGITQLQGDVTTPVASAGITTATIAVGAVTDTKASLSVKPAVTVVSISNLTLSGVQTIDGQLTVAGTSIVLATAQSAGAENGPWVVQSGAWTRPTWYPSGGTTQVFQFITTLVRLGTTYRGTTWRQGVAAPITIDTTATTWAVVPYTLGSTTVAGTLPVINGGTGQTSFTNGQLLIGNTTGNTLTAATLTAGSGIAITNGTGSITITSQGALTERTLTTADTLASTDNVILLNSTGGAFNLTLPAASSVANRVFQLKDISGVINTNNVTLVRNGSNSIEGLAANKILTTNYGGYRLYSTGSAWWLL